MGRGDRLPLASLQAIERPLGGLTQARVGCERIAGTPIPFGLTTNGLALDAMSRSVEHSLRKKRGDHPLAPELQPVDARLT